MTTANSPHTTRWRQITASALLGTTVIFGVALGSATVANADAKSLQTRMDAFDKCVHDGGTYQSCCVAVAGEYWTKIGQYGHLVEGCTFSDGRTVTGPTRTAIIPSSTSTATSIK